MANSTAILTDAPSPSSSLTVASPRGINVTSREVNLELMTRLSSVIPWNRLQNPPGIYSSSRSSAALSILMPEEFDGQHDILSMNFSTSRRGIGDRLAVELYLLSNNLTSHEPRGKSIESLERHDSQVLGMLKHSGWDDPNHLQILLTTREPTAESIAEKIFASALRSRNFEILESLLNAGMDPNGLVDTVPEGNLTPLQFALVNEDNKLVEMLISYKADVNLCVSGRPALYYAVKSEDIHFTNTLLTHGAIVTPICLLALAESKTARLEIETVQFMIRSCPDVNSRAGWQDPSALVQAVRSKNYFMIDLLLSRGAEINDLVTIDFETEIDLTTILGLAAMKGDMGLMDPLLQACKDMNPKFDGLPYISPLTLAVQEKRIEVITALLDAGIDLATADSQGEMTLLERAARGGDLLICSLLIENGAKIDREPSEVPHSTSALLIAVKKESLAIVELLVQANARLNDEYSKAPGSILGAAIELGNAGLITYLSNAGATAIGTKLERIGNIQTATFIQQLGILPMILQFSGEKMLAAAILAGKDDMAHFFLWNGIDFSNEGIWGDNGDNSDEGDKGTTPLEAAIRKLRLPFIQILLDRGAKVTDGALVSSIEGMARGDVNSGLITKLLAMFHGDAPNAVTVAVTNSSLKSLELLRGANIDPVLAKKRFERGWGIDDVELAPPESILDVAAVYSCDDGAVLRYLLEWTTWSAKDIGRALTVAILLEQYSVLDDLLSYDCDFNQDVTIEYPAQEDEYGNLQAGTKETYTSLQAAVSKQLVKIVEKMSQRADVNYLGKGVRRRTPLQLAVQNGNMEIFNILRERGAKINGPPAEHGGTTALQIAAIQGFIGIARHLLDLGADLNEAPARYFGRTALQGAAEHGRIDMLQMLLEAGTLIVGEGEEQYSKAVELAQLNGHNAAARLLRSFRDTVQLSPS